MMVMVEEKFVILLSNAVSLIKHLNITEDEKIKIMTMITKIFDIIQRKDDEKH
jgi:hypothetical protein